MRDGEKKPKASFFERLAIFIVDKRNLFFLIYIAGIIFSVFSTGWVSVNNDLTSYLPEDTETRQGLSIMEDEFVTLGTADFMISNITYEQAEDLVPEIEEIEGVSSVAFDRSEEHYKDSSALYSVTFQGEANDEISIEAFSNQASYDAWSQGKTIVLSENLDLTDKKIDPIPSFGGVFEGNGHTVKISFEKNASHQGLFRYLQTGGVIKELHVEGMIMPSGDQSYIGGIAGQNLGTITQCTNSSSVNTIERQYGGRNKSSDGQTESNAVERADTATDTGGIAGYSAGVIQGCVNDGEIGYPHVGYNVGGIVGHSSGRLDRCRNNGTIYGRKDVGGIIGQMVPDIILQFSPDAISELKNELNELKSLIDTMLNHADSRRDSVGAELNKISAAITDIMDHLHGLSGMTTDWINGNLEKIDNASSLLFDAILQNCLNYGTITAKKNHVGSVVGLMELGLVHKCEGYGKVCSTDGSYVGGIAGKSTSTIQNSYAKCTLEGKDFVGGITGYGYCIKNCGSLVEIVDAAAFSGAIAGDREPNQTVSGNYFVSDVLAGIDGISYKGAAEPMEYSSFIEIEGVPEEFTKFSLTYIADGEIVETVPFSYGANLSDHSLPELPKKEGCYGEWEECDYSRMTFSKEIEAIYTPYITTVASDAKRDDIHPVALAEETFDDTVSFSAKQLEADEQLEKWSFQLAGKGVDDQMEYVVRFLPPETNPKIDLYAVTECKREKYRAKQMNHTLFSA